MIHNVLSKTKSLTKSEIKYQVTGGKPELFEDPEAEALGRLAEEVLRGEEKDPESPIMVAQKKKKNAKAYKLRSVGQRPTTKKPETDTDDSSSIGKAGEFSVLAECIAAGYNASLMAVDKGIDIVASKDNVFYYIQVKTSYLDETERFSVHIPTANFNRVQGFGNVVYIAVLREWIGAFKYFIFRQRDIEILIRQGCIEDSGANINIKFVYDDVTHIPYLYNGKERIKADAYLAGTGKEGRFVL